jgi:short-subunit dehydrogenase
MADRNLTGRVVVITGASSGFGKGAAREFANRGASLVLAARREELLEQLAHECGVVGQPAAIVRTDVSNAEDVERLAEKAIGDFGRIDVWVNNAGAGAIGRFDEVPLLDHVQVIETDLMGTLYGSYFAMKHFRRQNSGILINIASVIGKVPAPYYSSYAAAKHGVVGLSAALRMELREENIESIRVCTVLPTSTDTPFFEHAANFTGHKALPIPPVYDPEEVIEVIVRLATDPNDEVAVGAAAKMAILAHNVAPGITEKAMAKKSRRTHIEKAPTAKETHGGLLEPSPTGTEVSGGNRKKSD